MNSSAVFDLSRNYFELFGLPVIYQLDVADLSDRYHALRQMVHPDRYASAGDREKRLAFQTATLVNEAFQVLKDPLSRGRYLLTLWTGSPGDGGTTKDMTFLMEQMALREALAEARRGPDPYAVIETIRQRLTQQEEQYISDLMGCLAAKPDTDFEEARELLRKLQFIRKAGAEVAALEEELDEAL